MQRLPAERIPEPLRYSGPCPSCGYQAINYQVGKLRLTEPAEQGCGAKT